MNFWKAKWWQKLIFGSFVFGIFSVMIWLLIIGVWYGFQMIGKLNTPYLVLLTSRAGLLVLLGSAIITLVGSGWIAWKERKNFKNNPITADTPQWLKQEEYRKRILTSFDKLTIPLPSFVFGYEEEKKGIFKGTREVYSHVLAIDKKLVTPALSPEITVKDNQTFIGSKSLQDLAGGSIVVIGGAGSGKTINVIDPSIVNLLKNAAKPSLVVTDPKNELFSSSAAFAVKQGYKVIKFDLSKPESSDQWNFLEEVYELYHHVYLSNWYKLNQLDVNKKGGQATTVEQRAALAANIAKAKSKIARLVERYSGFIGSVTGGHNVEFQKKGRSLAGMFMLLPLDMGVSKSDYTPYMCAYTADTLNFELPIIIEQLPPWALCKTLMGDLKPMSIGTTATQNFLQNARGNLSVFLDQDIRDLTSKSTFNLDEIINQPTIIYLTMPTEEPNSESDTKESSTKITRLASLLISSIYAAINKHLGDHNKTNLDRPFIFMLEELINLGRLDFVEQIYSIGRGKNVFGCIVIQSVSQIDKMYGVHTRKTIFNNAGAIIITNVGNDIDTARYLSELSGNIKKERKSKSFSDTGEEKGYTISTEKSKAIESGDFSIDQKPFDFFVMLKSVRPYKMTTKPMLSGTVFEQLQAEIQDIDPEEVLKKDYQPEIDSKNLYTDIIPTLSKRFWMSRVQSRLDSSKNYQIQFEELNSMGLHVLNSNEYELVNEFIQKHGWLPGFGIDKFISGEELSKFYKKMEEFKSVKNDVKPVSDSAPKSKPTSQKNTKTSKPIKEKNKKSTNQNTEIEKTTKTAFHKSKDPSKLKKQLAVIKRKEIEKRKADLVKELL